MPLPLLEIYDHQEHHPVHLDRWQTEGLAALPHVLDAIVSSDAPLAQLELVEISLVSDDAITQVHADFLDDPTPTDVITFHHGEILISLDTAQRQAEEHGESFEREVTRYIVHGLLHLAGWNDVEPSERKAMHETQERILHLIL